jgi:hypothetical protein
MKKWINAIMILAIFVHIGLYVGQVISQLEFYQAMFMYPCVWVLLLSIDYKKELK